MFTTVRAIVKEGQIKLLEDIALLEGTELLITALTDEENFWLKASEETLKAIWDNPEVDIYAELL